MCCTRVTLAGQLELEWKWIRRSKDAVNQICLWQDSWNGAFMGWDSQSISPTRLPWRDSWNWSGNVHSSLATLEGWLEWCRPDEILRCCVLELSWQDGWVGHRPEATWSTHWDHLCRMAGADVGLQPGACWGCPSRLARVLGPCSHLHYQGRGLYKHWCLAPQTPERVQRVPTLFGGCSRVSKWLSFTYSMVTL